MKDLIYQTEFQFCFRVSHYYSHFKTFTSCGLLEFPEMWEETYRRHHEEKCCICNSEESWNQFETGFNLHIWKKIYYANISYNQGWRHVTCNRRLSAAVRSTQQVQMLTKVKTLLLKLMSGSLIFTVHLRIFLKWFWSKTSVYKQVRAQHVDLPNLNTFFVSLFWRNKTKTLCCCVTVQQNLQAAACTVMSFNVWTEITRVISSQWQFYWRIYCL